MRADRLRRRKPLALFSPDNISFDRCSPSIADTYMSAKTNSLSTFTSVKNICCSRGSLISRMSISESSWRMRSAIRWSLIPDGIAIFTQAGRPGFSTASVLPGRFQYVTNDLITDFDVVEVLQADPTLESSADFARIFFLVFQ